MFNGPIPGESLTREPGSAPWEQPPKYAKVEEALSFYMRRLEGGEAIEDLLFLLDQGAVVEVIVQGMLVSGEMKGLHTFDTSFLIAPVLHEYITALAEAAGVTYKEFQGPSKEERAKKKFISDIQLSLKNAPQNEDTLAEEVVENIEEAESRVSPKGLMARKRNV